MLNGDFLLAFCNRFLYRVLFVPFLRSDYFGSRIDLLLHQSALLLLTFPAVMQVDKPVVLVVYCK